MCVTEKAIRIKAYNSYRINLAVVPWLYFSSKKNSVTLMDYLLKHSLIGYKVIYVEIKKVFSVTSTYKFRSRLHL